MKKIVFLILVIFIIGCDFEPSRKDYKFESCFNFSNCMYRNRENKDKSVCVEFAKTCSADRKQQRIIDIYNFCKEAKKRAKGHDFNGCFDKLYLK